MTKRYKKSKVDWFHKKTTPRWKLSNMAGQMPIYWPLEKIPENRWGSSEQLYQASKYSSTVMCVPKSNPDADPCVRNRIRARNDARGAKLTQKCAVEAGLVRSDWESKEVRLKAMLWVLELKLYWNPESFGEALRRANRPIVEISTKDDFWGCNPCSKGVLRGENHMGRLLMHVRSRRRAVLKGKFTYPKGFLLP